MSFLLRKTDIIAEFSIKSSNFAIIYYKLHTMGKNINRIKVVLAEKQKTNKWLAEQLDCAPTTVSKWCTNACQAPMETYIKISKLLDVELTELVRLE